MARLWTDRWRQEVFVSGRVEPGTMVCWHKIDSIICIFIPSVMPYTNTAIKPSPSSASHITIHGTSIPPLVSTSSVLSLNDLSRHHHPVRSITRYKAAESVYSTTRFWGIPVPMRMIGQEKFSPCRFLRGLRISNDRGEISFRESQLDQVCGMRMDFRDGADIRSVNTNNSVLVRHANID